MLVEMSTASIELIYSAASHKYPYSVLILSKPKRNICLPFKPMLIFLFTSQFCFIPVQRMSAAYWANCLGCKLLLEILFVQKFKFFNNVAQVLLAAVLKFFNWKMKTQFHLFIFMFVITLHIQYASCMSNKHTESSLLPPRVCSFVLCMLERRSRLSF
jgi:hypothetical protein